MDNNYVISLFKNGMSVSDISRKTGLSRQGIYNILNKNGINYKKTLKTIQPDMLRDTLRHKTIAQVVRETGIPYHRIRTLMNKYDIEKNEIMRDILKVDDVEHLYNDCGFTDEQIGRIFKCSQYTVRSFRWRNNIYDKSRMWQDVLSEEKFISMRQSGLSLAQIARELDLPYHIVIAAQKMYNDAQRTAHGE